MSSQYRNNHYVPVWYQKRFLRHDSPANNLWYLDLAPGTFTDPRGVVHDKWPLKKRGLSQCFAAKDLYRAQFGTAEPTQLEQRFFGTLDSRGRRAVEYWAAFEHPSADHDAFQDFMSFMTVQKLRTPKGLGWLAGKVGRDRDKTLESMVRLQQVHSAIWTECVWQIADASESATKFIISDHPVTVYNRRCGPRSQWCRGHDDPDIALQGSHTVFPLSLDKILILTHLSWVRNPYQSEVATRPNANPWRAAIFNFTSVQTRRRLSEQEVREINFIIKQRALRYVAAGAEEWLYPEQHVSRSDWGRFGNGYLLMPDPRSIHLGGQIVIGHRGGGASHFDAYGRRPWQKEYDKEALQRTEARTLYKFKGEFARLFGPARRGRQWRDDAVDSVEFHQYHLGLEKGIKRTL